MGKTIFISSHILPELADFCNKIGIIEQGELVVSGDVEEIMRRVQGGKSLSIEVDQGTDRAIALLSACPNIKGVRQEGASIIAEFATDDVDQSQILRLLIEQGLRVKSFSETRVGLEDIFMRVTRGIVS